MTATPSIDLDQIDVEILELGEDVWQRTQGEVPGLFDKDYWQGLMLEWVMKDPEFKVDMFRFVDVLPTLQTTKQVSQHVREYLLRENRKLPTLLNAALKVASGGLAAGLAARTIRRNVTEMAERFIIGEDVKKALPNLRKLYNDNIGFTVDLLGEATLSNLESEAYLSRYFEILDTLADKTSQWPDADRIDTNHLGPIPRCNISLKVSAMDPHLGSVDPKGSVARLKERVLPLFLHAKKRNVFINVDLEQWEYHGVTYDLFEEIVTHPELRAWPHLGIVIQAYLRSARYDLDRLLSIAKTRGMPLTIRLVKGAYWDYEVVHAKQYGYPCPVFLNKGETDANYEALSTLLLENYRYLQPAFGSHNLRSLVHALVQARRLQVPEKSYEIQMLYGMAEPMRKVLCDLGHRIRVYAPIGEMLPGISYLVRRLLENTSNSGFLRLSYHEKTDVRELLQHPVPQMIEASETPPPAMQRGDLTSPFENCPHSDFTDPDLRSAFAEAVHAVELSLPWDIPTVINGEMRYEGETLNRYCPSEIQRLVGTLTLGSLEEVENAVQTAQTIWPEWRDRPLAERAMLLEELADCIETDRMELAALQAWEVGKPWKEADADVAEAVDFCRYYARQAIAELSPQQQGNMEGEANLLIYEGRGPAAVIAPWNFPMAILCGMTAAALVTGNPVIMKPAEQSSITAYALYQRMQQVGFPAEVVQFLPGLGEDVGEALVTHLGVAQIVFTGSKAVGLSIVEKAGKTQIGQSQVKRVVCEMGGKNAIIVDDDADLDAAVSGILHSAFSYAGQKCSACSRVIVVKSVYDMLVERLVEACKSVLIAPAHFPECQLGPVVDETAHQRLWKEIEHPEDGVETLYIGTVPEGGWYVPPVLFAVTNTEHPVMQEEFFGPIVALIAADSFEEALALTTTTDFALTGAVYSRSPQNLDLARKRFRVGNLYFNRASTGSLVDRQPFGGFGMSGIGTKAGGPGYLKHFVDPRCITENTMRRGFTPELAM